MCKDCKGEGICPHGRQRPQCKEGQCLNYKKWAKHLINAAKARSKKYGYHFDLTFEKDGNHIMRGLETGCPVFHTPFRRAAGQGQDSATLEKFNPALGYITGNVYVLSRRANAMKQDATSWRDIQALANWMKKIERKKTRLFSVKSDTII